MRKVVVSEFVSLDGVMEDPSWEFPFPGRRTGEVQVRRAGRCRRSPAGQKDLRGFRGCLARHDGALRRPSPESPRRIHRHDERLPQARRLDDPPGAARMEQLYPHKGRRCRRGRGAKAARGQRHPRLRQRAAGEDVDGARPHRRVPPDGFPDPRGQRQAPLRGRGGRENPGTGGLEDVRHGVVSLAYRLETS